MTILRSTCIAVSTICIAGCGDAPKLDRALDLVADRAMEAAALGSVRSILELPDGRSLVTSYSSSTLTLFDSAGAVSTQYANPGFQRVTDIALTADGRVLVLDGSSNTIHVLRVTGADLVLDDSIPTSIYGQTMAMCAAENRIFVIGARDAQDSMVVHEISWQGRVINSFAQPRSRDVRELRGMRLAQLACSARRLVLARPGTANLLFFELTGRPAGIISVPGYGDPVYMKNSDPFEPKVRRNEWDDWITVHYAPDGSLVAQFAHYAGRHFDKTVTQTFDEKSGWSARSGNLPRIIALGARHAYGTAPERSELMRYAYRAHVENGTLAPTTW